MECPFFVSFQQSAFVNILITNVIKCYFLVIYRVVKGRDLSLL